MPIFEHERGGRANGPIENSGEEHLPCVVLVDTSGSMASAMGELNDALNALGEAIKDDPQAVGTVEICVIAFDDHARIVMPFGPAYDFEAPELDCGGLTAMHEAIDLALSELDARKAQYRAARTNFKRPWVFMLTDGGANDEDNGAFERLLDAQKGRHCTFFSIGIGKSADMELLKSLRPDGMTFGASKENFKEAFVWLGNSLSVTSSSQRDAKIALPEIPKQITIEV